MSKTALHSERLVPEEMTGDSEKYLLYLRHLKAYEIARDYVRGKNVLEIGCGTGYGAEFLADAASTYLGVDVDSAAVDYCVGRRRKSNLRFRSIEQGALPFKDNEFDVCLSFQVIEHIVPNAVDDWLLEIGRVLKSNGTFIITTPNRALRLLPFQKPWNRHHKREYDYKQLARLCQRYADTRLLGLRGEGEVQRIEEHRVRQNPFTVFIGNPLSRLLPASANRMLASTLKRFKYSPPPLHGIPASASAHRTFTTDDFVLDDTNLERCIDLYVIGTKS